MDDRVNALLSAWQEQQLQGRDLPVAELCRDCPELAAELGRLIGVLRRVKDLVQPRSSSAAFGAPNMCAQTASSNGQTGLVNEVARTLGSSGPTASSPPAGAVPGYEILEELGRGGMGVVYKARHLRLNRIVALKMILAGGYAGPNERARFLAEAEVIACLQHPNLVVLLEYGEHQGQPFFTLEYMPGGHLAEKLKGIPQPAAAAARLMEQLARGIHFAHTQGIVHRDLKPANVLFAEDGTPKISDFGLARRQTMGTGLTGTGEVLGTPSYMAPEQAGGKSKHAGPAADIYALGAILYECLTGRPPFRAATSVETVLQVMEQEPVSVRQLQPQTPVDLATICHKCLQKEPHKRYASAAELADDLQRWQAGQPVKARPVGRIEKSIKWLRRYPAAATAYGLLALVVVLGGLGGCAGWLWQSSEQARGKEKGKEKGARNRCW
ncbi:MAG TPA: serine/threonine-protein kinase [Gemmataceae bacterium]|nr:serine/threonine-protein kinase [Gemmataceae bacterium]